MFQCKTVEQWFAWRHMLGVNPEVASLWMKGCRGDELSETEKLRFYELARSFFLLYGIWESRASENEESDVFEIAVKSLVAELSDKNKAALLSN